MNFAEEYAVSKEKTTRILKDSVKKDAKQLKTAIANLCNTCGYANGWICCFYEAFELDKNC